MAPAPRDQSDERSSARPSAARFVEFSTESKYYGLHVHLVSAKGQTMRMTFGDVEAVLGFRLPPGARSNRAWWGNSRSGHSQSRAWLLAGWRMTDVDLEAEVVRFDRERHG